MLTAALAAVPIGLALAVAALPVALIPIALAAKRPPGIARAFLGGWLAGVLLIGALVIALVDVLVLPSGNPTWDRAEQPGSSVAGLSAPGPPVLVGGLASSADQFGYAKIVLGLLLVGLAVRRWVGRSRPGEEPPVPGWMAAIDTMSGGKAFGLALLLATANPKNLVLVIAGATTIAEETPVPAQQAIALGPR